MNKIIISLIISLLFISCSSNRCIEVFMKDEIAKNKEQKITSVLFSRKSSTLKVLEIYRGLKIGNRMSSQAKSFNQEDYDMLYTQYKNDTILEYWNKNESKRLNFERITKINEISKNPQFLNDSSAPSETYFYSLSKPIFINKNHALFSLLVSKGVQSIIKDDVIIMKKEKGKWVFLEKVHNTDLY